MKTILENGKSGDIDQAIRCFAEGLVTLYLGKMAEVNFVEEGRE